LIDHALPEMEGATLKNFLRIDCSTRSLNVSEVSCVDHATPELISTLKGYIVNVPELPLPFAMVDVGKYYPSLFSKKRINLIKGGKDQFTSADRMKLVVHICNELEANVERCIDTLIDAFFLIGFRKPLNKIKMKILRESLEGKISEAERILRKNNLVVERKYKEKFYETRNETITNVIKVCLRKGYNAWIDYFKYLTTAFYAYHMKQQPVAKPPFMSDVSITSILPGMFNSWTNVIKNKNKKDMNGLSKWTNLLETILLGVKKGMPKAPKWMIQQKELDTMKALTTEPSTLVPVEVQGPYSEIMITQDLVKDECRRIVREIFLTSIMTRKQWERPFVPSFNSNYNWSRSEYGAIGEFKHWLENQDYVRDKYKDLKDKKLVNITPVDLAVSVEINSKFQQDLRHAEQAEIDQRPGEWFSPGVRMEKTELDEIWSEIFWDLWTDVKTEKPYVQTVGLDEPLKIRVISKGPPKLYTCLHPLQKYMWRTLKQHPVFELISRPVTDDDINSLLKDMLPDEEINSGDYKASTDNLHSWISEELANSLVDIMNENGSYIPPDLREYFIRSLTKHIFIDEDGNELPQKEGQLMGSVTSFPILCLANAVLCRLAIEINTRKRYSVVNEQTYKKNKYLRKLTGVKERYNYNPLPLLVNGDDCLFRGKKAFNLPPIEEDGVPERRQSITEVWTAVAGFGGLTPSVGKSYTSDISCNPCFAVINSCTYYYNTETTLWKRVKHVNMGLVYGQPKVGSREKLSYNDLGTLHRELFETCAPDCWELASAMFIKRNRSTLEQFPNIPWTMPRWLGGPGLIADKECKHNHKDRLCASIIRSGIIKLKSRRLEYAVELDKYVKTQLNLDKIYFEKGRPLLGAEEVDIFTTVLEDQDLKENSLELYASLCIETVLTQPVDKFTTLCFEGVQERNELQDYKTNRYNCSMWCRAAKLTQDPRYNYIEPMKEVDVDPLKIETFFPVVVY
jgi:hypothetical protein